MHTKIVIFNQDHRKRFMHTQLVFVMMTVQATKQRYFHTKRRILLSADQKFWVAHSRFFYKKCHDRYIFYGSITKIGIS
jgi:hypothetical protein